MFAAGFVSQYFTDVTPAADIRCHSFQRPAAGLAFRQMRRKLLFLLLGQLIFERSLEQCGVAWGGSGMHGI